MIRTRRGQRAQCTCRWSSINSASIDPPHRIVDKWCPIHGRDPDEEYQKLKDREYDEPEYHRDFDD